MKCLEINFKALWLFITTLFKGWKNRKGDGMKTVVLVMALLMAGTLCFAQEITLKQGAVIGWQTGQIKNLTCVNVVKTKANPEWPKLVNAIWSGNVVDCGLAYDGSAIDTGAILIGRELGTLADYIPVEYPLLDKFAITIYPIGIQAKKIFERPQFEGISGGAIIQVGLKF